jgi:ATP phosphoribosyltransferase
MPSDKTLNGITDLNNQSIATSYPHLLQRFLDENKITATIIFLAGSVEIAPRLNIADAICDLVATGKTLKKNNLTEACVILQSQAVLIQSATDLNFNVLNTLNVLKQRINYVLQTEKSKSPSHCVSC